MKGSVHVVQNCGHDSIVPATVSTVNVAEINVNLAPVFNADTSAPKSINTSAPEFHK